MEVQPFKTETIHLLLNNIELSNSEFDISFNDVFEKREKKVKKK